ncbi:CAP domain-containing protein [Nitrosococcus watsonii]|uniref:SCP-like extracellular n=1 Tax=Nitrosococcus watsoni (strain C-113) TaxID=105559 RepID=D8K5J6_NITWC|nr:CAP domain-containing protein [Nitrosococcus watsonii]ADJ28173.1 SCP-like extracellular [Nitrosococcus watsonii C-113]
MYLHRKMLCFAFLISTLCSLSTVAFAIEEKLAIIKNNANGQGLTLQVYTPPLAPKNRLEAKLFQDVQIFGNVASLAAGNINGTTGDEFIFLTDGSFGSNGLYLYTVKPEDGALSFHLLADDRSLERNVQFATLCDCDSDPEKELAIIKRLQNGSHQLIIYDLPTRRWGNALAIAGAANIGNNIIGLSAGDMAGNSKSELVIAQKNGNGTVRVEIYSPPSSLSDSLGPPLLSYSDLGSDIIPDGLAVGDFDHDSEDEIALVRSLKNGAHGLDILKAPTAFGDEDPVFIASNVNIGQNVAKMTAFKINTAGPSFNQPPQAVVNANPRKGSLPLTVTLDGSNSQDADGFIQHYLWEFDNGQIITGPKLQYTYDTPGAHVVTLTVIDNENSQDSTQITIEATEAANNNDTTDSQNLLPAERELIKLINQERQKYNLASLKVHSALVTAAKEHSKDMAQNNFISHTGSDGSSPFTRMADAGYRFRTAGENVAAGYSSPQAVLAGWMNSPGHRRNLLNANYCELGVGYAYQGRSTYGRYWTLTLGCR